MSVREVRGSKAALHTRVSWGSLLQNADLASPSRRKGIFKIGVFSFFAILASAVLGQIDPDFDGLSCPVLA